jgi:hypothetical protein
MTMDILVKGCPSRLIQGTAPETPEGGQNLGEPQTEQAIFGPHSNTDPPDYGKKKVLTARLRRSPSAPM